MKLSTWAAAVALAAALSSPLAAQTVVFEENFDAAEVGTSEVTGPGPDVYLQLSNAEVAAIPPGFQVQGGTGGGATLTAGIEAVGQGGTNALSANWDTTAGTGYGWGQVSYYGAPAPPVDTPVHLVKVSLDIFMDGFNVNDPFEIVYQYPSADIPETTGGRAIRAQTVNGQYTTVSFMLNQTYGNQPPLFDGLIDVSSNIRFQYGQGGDGGTFGFDANNLIRVDNVKVEVITANADFNGDFTIDGDDFLIWQQNIGKPATTTFVQTGEDPNLGTLLVNGDANGDGTVDIADLAVWKVQYAGAPAVAAAASGVPEPSSLALAAGALALAGLRRTRRRR